MRGCDDCRRVLIDAQTGQVQTRKEVGPDGEETGRRVPVPRPANVNPPCAVCPKHAGTEKLADRVPLAADADPVAGWVNDAVGWAREGLAVGFDPPPDPLMRQVAAAVRASDERADRRALADAVADGVRRAVRTFGR